MPIKRLIAKNTRRKALKNIREYSPELAKRLERIADHHEVPLEDLKSIISNIKATKGTEQDRKLHANTIRAFLEKGYTYKDVAAMSPFLDATRRAGHDPHILGEVLWTGLESRALTHETMGEYADAVRKGLESAEMKIQDPNRYEPWLLAELLKNGLRSRVITSKNIAKITRDVKKNLDAAAKAEQNPRDLAQIFENGVKFKTISIEDLGEVGEVVRKSLKATTEAGQNPRHLVRVLKNSLKRKSLDYTLLQQHRLLEREIPKKWSNAEVLRHALQVKNVPSKRIATYQRMLMQEGHYPNAGLVEELHKEHVKARRKGK